MLRNKVRILFLFMVMIMMLAFSCAFANTNYTDIQKHWAQGEIEKWSDLEIIKGFEGLFRPDDNITRGEMAVILDRVLQFVDKAENKFVDLPQDFYTDAILKANYVGVMLGDAYTSEPIVRPIDNITRQEAVVMICRALSIEPSKIESKFLDKDQMADYSIEYINAMTQKGYVNGYGDTFKPLDNITRAEVVKILDNTIAKIYSKAGTYSEDIEGLVIINTPNVTLNDMTIKGDVIVSEGVGDKEVYFNDVEITGKLIARGGGENSIYFNGKTKIDKVVVFKIGTNAIRIKASDTAIIGNIEVNFGDIILTGTFENVTINSISNEPVRLLDANIQSLLIQSNNQITLNNNSNVSVIEVETQPNLTINGTVNNINISSNLNNNETPGGEPGTDVTLNTINIGSSGIIGSISANSTITINNEGKLNKLEANANDIVIDGNKPDTLKVDNSVETKPTNSEGKEVTTPSTKPSGGGGSSYTPPEMDICATININIENLKRYCNMGELGDYTNVEQESEGDMNFYIKIDTDLTEPLQSLRIGNEVFGYEEYIYGDLQDPEKQFEGFRAIGKHVVLNMGNEHYLGLYSWFQQNGALYVAVPILLAEATNTGKVDLNYNDRGVVDLVLKISQSQNKTLTLESATGKGVPAGYYNTVNVNEAKTVITQSINHGNGYIEFVLNDGDNPVLDHELVFTKEVITYEEDEEEQEIIYYGMEKRPTNNDITNLLYSAGYRSGPYQSSYDLNIDYTITIPEVGAVELELQISVIDDVAPTCTITANTTDITNIIYTFEFSEDVIGFTEEDISVSVGTKGDFREVYESKYTLVVTNAGAGEQVVSIGADVCEDESGNGNIAENKTIKIGEYITEYSDFATARSNGQTIFIVNTANGMENALAITDDFTLLNGERIIIPTGKYIAINSSKNFTLNSGSVAELMDGTTQVLAVGNCIINSGASILIPKDVSGEKVYYKYIGNDANSFYKLTNGSAKITIVNDDKSGIELNGDAILQPVSTLRNTEQICSGDKLTVKAGKTLTIASGTVLEIQAGGELILEEGATLVNNGSVIIKGKVTVNNVEQLGGTNKYRIDTIGTNNGAIYIGGVKYMANEDNAVIKLDTGIMEITQTTSVSGNDKGVAVEIISGTVTIILPNISGTFAGYYLIGILDEYTVNASANLVLSTNLMLTGKLNIEGTADTSLANKIYSHKNVNGSNLEITALNIGTTSYSPEFNGDASGTKYKWNGTSWEYANAITISGIEGKVEALFTNWYNKADVTSTQLTPTDTEYYIQVASGIVSIPSKIRIGGELFNQVGSSACSDLVSVSMGNNNFINEPAWKIVDGNLLIAIPVLMLEASPNGTVEIDIEDNNSIEIVAIVSSSEGGSLSLVSACALGSVGEGYINNVQKVSNTKVTQTINKGTGYLGFLLNDGTNNITDKRKVFTKKRYKDSNRPDANITSVSYGVTDTEGLENATIGFYAAGWKNGAFSIDEVKKVYIDYTVAVIGKGAINIELEIDRQSKENATPDVSIDFSTKVEALLTTFYNQPKGTTLTPTDAQYYIQVANKLGKVPNTIKIGDEVFDKAEGELIKHSNSVSVSMGNSNFINEPVWKLDENNNLLIAIPVLALEASPSGTVAIDIGNNNSVELTVTTSASSEENLSIASVLGVANVPGYINSAKIVDNKIIYKSGHGQQYLGILLKNGETNILNNTTKVFTKKVYKDLEGDIIDVSYGVTLTENPSTNVTVGFYAVKYKNGPFAPSDVNGDNKLNYKSIDYKMAIVGVGVEEVTIEVERQSNDISEELTDKLNALITNWYNEPAGTTIGVGEDDTYYIDTQIELNSASFPSAIKIGNTVFAKAEGVYKSINARVSMGNNNFIDLPAWGQGENGNLFIAIPILALESSQNGNVEIVLGSTGPIVKLLITGEDSDKTVTLTNAIAKGGKTGEGYTNTVSVNSAKTKVTQTIQHGTGYIGFILNDGTNDILDKRIVFTRKEFKDTAEGEVTKTEYGVTQSPNNTITSFFYAGGYNDGLAYTTPEDRYIDYTIAVPGIGAIELELEIHKTVKE